MRNGIVSVLVILFFAAAARGVANPPTIAGGLAEVQSDNPADAQKGIDVLRAAGQGGLAGLLDVYDRHPDQKLLPAIDAVAGQRGAVWSRLYWYTDLADAEAVAKTQNKPILYLRLMGKLTDEYSCANSRFFRTVLYANKAVSKMLRERFVLVWVSERPVPVVTIDYGDGRVLKRTLTGNSIHYVLDSSGRVYDALPGLFDPVTFGRIVNDAGGAAMLEEDRGRYFRRADDTILRQWKADGARTDPPILVGDERTRQAAEKADAAAAMRLTMSKAVIEAPLLRKMSPQFAEEMDRSIDAADDVTWRKIAAIQADDSRLDAQSIALIQSQNPTKYADAAALNRTVQQFQQTIAEDTARDNYKMRKQVLAWLLAEQSEPIALEDLNRRVYSELFLTPKSDQWLGLLPEGLYTALSNDGCCAAPAAAR